MVGRLRPALIIEVVNQAEDAPSLDVFSEPGGVMAHRGFDGQGVFQQGFGLGVFPQECQRFVTCHEPSIYHQPSGSESAINFRRDPRSSNLAVAAGWIALDWLPYASKFNDWFAVGGLAAARHE